VATLTGVFDRPLAAGATIIVIDHDLDLLAAADHLIDMGPGSGPGGGHIRTAGTPEDIARDPGGVTGPWLAQHLGLPEAHQPTGHARPANRSPLAFRSGYAGRAIPRANENQLQSTVAHTEPLLRLLKYPVNPPERRPATHRS
jgi:hypothetical protein